MTTDAIESVALARVRLMSPTERRRIRDAAGVSREAMARDLRCTSSAIDAWERGLRQPTGFLGAEYGRLLRTLAQITETASRA
jgi:DNA-binding transcriptional regulator YiaG